MTPLGGGPGVRPPATVGVVSALVVMPKPNRQGILLTNDSAAVIYLSQVEPAALNSGIRLNPNGGSYWEPDARWRVWDGAYYAISAGAGLSLLVTEW
jgi:hypothetical protein